MKTQKLIFSLVILVAILLAACSPQAAPTEVMAEKDTMSDAAASDAAAADSMEAKDDEMMSDQDDEMMSDEGDQMDKEDDAMMSDSDDQMEDKEDEMMSDHDDEMASDKDGEMMDDQMDDKEDDAMMSDSEDQMDKDDEMMSDHDDEMASDKDGEMMDDENDQMASGKEDDSMAEDSMMAPDWFKATLTDARSGETFTIADFKGKVVLVETLAMWCSNCLKQQGQVYALHDLIGDNDDFISLGIDIDPNENAAALSSYISNNGFYWLYTVAPTEVAREIGQLYGDQFLNPPSTPMLIIDRNGEVHPLPFGIKSAESLLEALQPFLDAEM